MDIIGANVPHASKGELYACDGRRKEVYIPVLPPMTGRDAVVVARYPGACLMYDGMSKGLRTGGSTHGSFAPERLERESWAAPVTGS